MSRFDDFSQFIGLEPGPVCRVVFDLLRRRK
jgi:hypothetical protein